MLEQMTAVLEKSGFFIRNPRERVLLHLREILNHGVKTSQDARIIRGIFRRIAWALEGGENPENFTSEVGTREETPGEEPWEKL